MNRSGIRTTFSTIVMCAFGSAILSTELRAEEFSFKATNTTRSVVTEVLVSENKSDWGYFDIGSGIKPGTTASLTWDQSTNNEGCKQWVKATYADGSESEPARFDFCEDGLEIEF